MKVTYLDSMGDDLTPVNRARLSFDKQSDWSDEYSLSEKDVTLTNYLAREEHVLPFRHPHITLHIKAPIFVIRQLDKHQVGFSTSEVSRRYVSDEPEFYYPEVWRKASVNKKQGSSDEEVLYSKGNNDINGTLENIYLSSMEWALKVYNDMIDSKVCPEQARIVLPQSMYTEQAKTGSLLGWFHLWKLRSSPDAQWEVQQIAKQVEEIIEPLFPCSWRALKNE